MNRQVNNKTARSIMNVLLILACAIFIGAGLYIGNWYLIVFGIGLLAIFISGL